MKSALCYICWRQKYADKMKLIWKYLYQEERTGDIYLFQSVQSSFGTHPASSSVRTRGAFFLGKETCLHQQSRKILQESADASKCVLVLIYQTTRHHIPKHSIYYGHRCLNLNMFLTVLYCVACWSWWFKYQRGKHTSFRNSYERILRHFEPPSVCGN